MTKDEIWDEVNRAYRADKKNYPHWPDHVCGQAAKVVIEAGYLQNIAVDKKYNAKDEFTTDVYNAKMKDSAVNTIVQSIRFLENL